jgi:SAM-dependent methyltransferase
MDQIEATNPPEEVRRAVRSRYSKIASSAPSEGGSSCCTPADSGCGCEDPAEALDLAAQFYSSADLETLPDEVTGLSLGCGDPVTLAELEPGQIVLDLGAGGGLDCFIAGARVGERGRVIGVDMTPEMVERGRANGAKLGASNVEFRLGEIEHLPVADGEVDVVISNCVINLSTDKPQVMREAYRALRPGGRLAFSDMVTAAPLPRALQDSLEAWAGCIAGALTVETYIAELEAVGFTDVALVPVYMDQAQIEDALRVMTAKPVGVEANSHPGHDPLGGAARKPDPDDQLTLDPDRLQRAIFSAKITARKPE